MPIKGFRAAARRMKKRAEAFSGGKPYSDTGSIASRSIAKNVNVGGRPKWQKRKGNYSHPILDKTGTMRDSAEDTATKWQHQSVWHNLHILGPKYGVYHQYTGIRTKIGGHIQKVVRKYVVFQKSELREIREAFSKAFHKP